MVRKRLSWIMTFVNDLPTKEEKIACLRANPALKPILRYSLDPAVKWLLPSGKVPYEPADLTKEGNLDAVLYTEARKLYLFVEGGNSNLKQPRREYLFIQFMQSLHPDDAKLMISVKDKKLPYKTITKELVLEAFPDLF